MYEYGKFLKFREERRHTESELALNMVTEAAFGVLRTHPQFTPPNGWDPMEVVRFLREYFRRSVTHTIAASCFKIYKDDPSSLRQLVESHINSAAFQDAADFLNGKEPSDIHTHKEQ